MESKLGIGIAVNTQSRVGWTTLFLAILLCAPVGIRPAIADDLDDDLAAIKARLSLLEIQNAELRSQLSNPTSVFNDVVPAAGAEDDDQRIRRMIEKYMQEQADKKQAEEKAGSDLAMTGKWNNGLEFSTKDKAFRIHIGGRTQFDTGFYSTDTSVAPPEHQHSVS